MCGHFSTNNLIRIFWLASLLAIFTGSLSAANLHLILVGDYEARELMPALKFDITNMRREAREISANTGLKVVETVLTGRDARTASVLAKLNALEPGSNDVVFFYFTGHGFRMPSKGNNQWPYLYFTAEDLGVDFSEVYDILSSKNGRLKILMVDGCNNVLAEHSVPIVKEVLRAGYAPRGVRENYKKLFLDSYGTIAIATCGPGQTSLALSNGSLYTLCFLKCLHKAVHKPSYILDWQSFLDEVSGVAENMAKEIDEVQSPIFLIVP